MSGPYYYYLGYYPWTFDESLGDDADGFFGLPSSCVGSIDLRSIPHQSIAGEEHTPSFFACSEPLDSGYTLLGQGDCREIFPTPNVFDAWESVTGYRPSGDRLVDLLWDHLTSGSDPSGDDRAKPLIPTAGGILEVHLGGHSVVRRERFRFGEHPHTNKVQDLLQRDFRKQWEYANRPGTPQVIREHPLRILDASCEKYGISKSDWAKLVPPDLRQHINGPLPHRTSISESFNQGDSTILGPDLSWTETSGNFWTISGRCRHLATSGVFKEARAESALSSADHYCQQDNVTATGDGSWYTLTRFDASARTYYRFYHRQSTDATGIQKVVNTAVTNLQDGDNVVWSSPETMRLNCSGSTLTGLIAAVQRCTTTDTSITGNVYCGLGLNVITATKHLELDDWEAGDLFYVTEDTFQNAEPYTFDESIGTAQASGGTEPYTWKTISETLQ